MAVMKKSCVIFGPRPLKDLAPFSLFKMSARLAHSCIDAMGYVGYGGPPPSHLPEKISYEVSRGTASRKMLTNWP